MIPVNEPKIAKNARKYILDCIRTGWVSSAGSYISRFETEFARYLGVKYAVTTSSGTTALHLALASIGVGPQDEVIVPDLTIISCAFAAMYLGANPVLVDVDPKIGNIDPKKIEEKITKKTKAIMVVHLYGHPCDIKPIIKIAKKHKLLLVEDAAEAHGAEYLSIISNLKNKQKWEKVGSFGDAACFSFYGNKIVTSGEGGMVVTNNKKIYERAIFLKDLAHSKKRRFLHEEMGYNFRLTNLQAALGLAQLEEIDKYIDKKRHIAQMYNAGLQNIEYLELPVEMPWAKNVYWMFAPLIKNNTIINREKFCEELRKLGVDTRTYFIPLHSQPVLKKFGLEKGEYPVSSDLAQRGFYLPSGLAITEKQIKKVISSIKDIALKLKHGKIK